MVKSSQIAGLGQMTWFDIYFVTWIDWRYFAACRAACHVDSLPGVTLVTRACTYAMYTLHPYSGILLYITGRLLF